jgi:hypothetical protein
MPEPRSESVNLLNFILQISITSVVSALNLYPGFAGKKISRELSHELIHEKTFLSPVPDVHALLCALLPDRGQRSLLRYCDDQLK